MKCKLSNEDVRNLFFDAKGRTWDVRVGERRTEEEPNGSVEKMCGSTDRRCNASVRLLS